MLIELDSTSKKSFHFAGKSLKRENVQAKNDKFVTFEVCQKINEES